MKISPFSILILCVSVLCGCKKIIQREVTLSPSNNPNEINVTELGGLDASDKTSIEEPLAAWSIGGVPVINRNLLNFDLSGIPAQAVIIKAHLYLYSDTIPKNGDLVHANYGADNSFVIQQVESPWD